MYKACCQLVFVFYAQQLCFVQNYPLPLRLSFPNQQQIKTVQMQTGVPQMMNNPHSNTSITLCSHCYNICSPLLTQKCENLLADAHIAWSIVKHCLTCWSLHQQCLLCVWISDLSGCVGCHISLRAPRFLPAGAAPSAHHPCLLSSATLQHSKGRRMLALLDHFLSVIPVPSLFQTIPFIASDF